MTEYEKLTTPQLRKTITKLRYRYHRTHAVLIRSQIMIDHDAAMNELHRRND